MEIAPDKENMVKSRYELVNWRWWWLAAWAGFMAWLLFQKWGAIHWFALGDTDDNMRMSQVRALLHGQGWYDLRQYKLNPPSGFNIHWTRLVDLPIAGLILATRPFFGGVVAEKIAVAVAPMLPLGLALYALMLVLRRLVHPHAWPIALLILAFADTTLAMWTPLRIDHHGWQLALLMLMLAGGADRDRLRGGVIAGLAAAASLTIGLEMLPYLALGGTMTVLAWVRHDAAAIRLRGYGAALAGGCAIGYALFASYDNRAYVCDVLSPVYLSTMLAAGALCVLLSMVPLKHRLNRFFVALAGGALLAIAFALLWPDCLGRPERISPELDQLWFRYIREAKPMWSQGYRVYVPVFAISVIGALGSVIALWRNRSDERVMAWATVTALSMAATGMLFWQTRAGPAAQLLAVPGATWLGWRCVHPFLKHDFSFGRLFIAALGLLVVTGQGAAFALNLIPRSPETAARKHISLANRQCPTLPALAPIARMPATTILTFVDMGPRLITVTHHSAVAGPYHRNGPAILDVQHSFRSRDPEVAHGVMRRHGATLLLLCPGMSESTIYASESRHGFYKQLVSGQVPQWLEPVALPKGSPFLLWKRIA